ncbi:hypothetical protein IAT38_005296 [Cryptococcus sp. DSM 104549]
MSATPPGDTSRGSYQATSLPIDPKLDPSNVDQTSDRVSVTPRNPSVDWASKTEEEKSALLITTILTAGALPAQSSVDQWHLQLPQVSALANLVGDTRKPEPQPVVDAASEFLDSYAEAQQDALVMGETWEDMKGLVKPSLDEGAEAIKAYTEDYFKRMTTFDQGLAQRTLDTCRHKDMFNAKIVGNDEFLAAGGGLLSMEGEEFVQFSWPDYETKLQENLIDMGKSMKEFEMSEHQPTLSVASEGAVEDHTKKAKDEHSETLSSLQIEQLSFYSDSSVIARLFTKAQEPTTD